MKNQEYVKGLDAKFDVNGEVEVGCNFDKASETTVNDRDGRHSTTTTTIEGFSLNVKVSVGVTVEVIVEEFASEDIR